MSNSKKILLLVFVGLLFEAKLVFPFPINNPNEKFNNKRKGVELDKLGRIINDPGNGKINYLWHKLDIDITRKGNSKAKSTFFSTLPDNTFMTTNHSLQRYSSFNGDTLSLEEDWRVGIFGSGIGKSGIITADVDNDGVIEIICGGSTSTFGLNNFWYILEYSPVSKEYTTQWISDLYPEGLSNITVIDVDNSGTFNIFIGFSNGDIHIYDGYTLEEVSYIDSPASSINRILFDDADNDSVNEITFCDNENVFIYNAISLSLENQIPYGASDFEIGNVDSDPANEIVLASGEVLEFSGVTTIVEWDYQAGDFGYLIELSDIDSDNMKEIIGASSWYTVTAFDADIQSPKWQIPTDIDVDALLVRDVDGDGVEDVLYGDGQWGEIHCYDAVTVNQKWQINNPEHGVTNVAVFDTDSDGDMEVLWGAGASSTGADYLYVYGIPTLSFEWQSQHIDGPFHAIDVGDVDSDGEHEIVFVSFESNSGYDDGIILIFDTITHLLEWQSGENMFGGNAWTGIHDVKIGDVDDDGEPEIVVATDRLYDGAIYIINGISHVMEQSYFYDDAAPIYSLAIVDVDNDGQTEIVAGGGREHTGAPGVFVYVINGSTGVVEWKSISLGNYWSEIYTLEVGDIDNDTVPEIVAINNNIFIFDGITHQQWQSTRDGCYGLDLFDTDNDGIQEIVVGTNDGNIVAIDGQSYAEELNINASSSSIVGLQTYDIDQSGSVEIIFGSSGMLNVFDIQESTLLWQSEILGSSAGKYNSLVVSDIDSDDKTEVIIGTNYYVIEFEGPYVTSIPPPSNLTISLSDHIVTLNWESPENVTPQGYNIYRSNETPVEITEPNKIGTVEVSTTTFVDTLQTSGTTYYYVVTAGYAGGESRPSNEVEVEVIVNHSPVITNTIPDTTLTVGGADFSRDLNADPVVFADPDGDELNYTSSSSAKTIASASVSGSILTVSPLSEGRSTITVTADDGKEGTVSTDFEVEVKSEAVKPFLPWLRCLVLDGNDDYAEAEDHPELDVGDEIGESLTVEAWVNFADFSSADIVTKPNAYTLYTKAYTSMGTAFRGLTFVVRSNGSNLIVSVGTTVYGGGFWISGWHHVAGVYDKTTGQLSLYMDGEQLSSWDAGQVEINNSDQALRVGSNLNGQIEEIRISDNARYTTSTYTVPTSHYEADGHTRSLWHLDESEGSTECHDSGGHDNLLICHNGAYIFVSVDYSDFETPEDYQLYQNYPNPFNPSTRISYSIPKSDFVILETYDMLGRKVQTLVSKFQEAGKYSVNFDASKLSSSIYFYKLQVGHDFVETKKMLFVR